MVARLHGCDAFTDGFNDACAFVAEDNGEGAFGVLAGEGVCIYEGANLAMILYSLVQPKGRGNRWIEENGRELHPVAREVGELPCSYETFGGCPMVHPEAPLNSQP